MSVIDRPPQAKCGRILGTVVGKTLAPDPDPEPALRIYLAGGIALQRATGESVGEGDFAGRQARRLFVRLASFHEPLPLVELADDLWDTEWPTAWQVSVRALISKLRATLAVVGAADAISSRDAAYELHLPADTWLDVDAAADSIHRAETRRSAGDDAAAAGWALAARAIATRPLLPGEDGEWLDILRRRLMDVRLRALECLAEIWVAQGDPALAARDAVEAIGIDPYRETAHRLLIRAHIAAGDRAAAVHAFEACRETLRDELGIAPSPETSALMASVVGTAPRP
jgi:SARP family transcriptional regulator, regulator of embCAB operon